MNYLSHAYQYLETPRLAAGTAIPDWLSVVDRRVRVRSRRAEKVIDYLVPQEQEIARGALQHLQDDHLFHTCPVFMRLEARVASWFRSTMPDRGDHRPGFLGHILVELLLDDVIAERTPGLLDAYYDALRRVRPDEIQRVVNQLCLRTTTRLAEFIEKFIEARVIYDYSDDHRLLLRLNQVLLRVRLQRLGDDSIKILSRTRELVREFAADLLAVTQVPADQRPAVET